MGQHMRLAPGAYPCPIPARPDAALVAVMAERVVAAWHAARPEYVVAGRDWYPAAHRLAKEISAGDVRTGAGVLAALSPQISWSLNVELAQRAFADGRASGHFRDATRKADRIMSGADPCLVLPVGRKTWHFHRCILDPTDHEPIVIDRHAHDIAVGVDYGNGSRGLDALGRYRALSDAYRAAARELGEIPSTVQAVTWVAHVGG